MIINIQSEVDSRIILYPLMKTLKSYGSVLILTSNKQLRRLIEDEENNTCREFTIIIDESGASDDIYTNHDIRPDDFDFIVLDNMGVVEYDTLIIPLGAMSSPEFDDNVQLMLESEDSMKMHIVQFGTNLKKQSPKQESKSKDKSTSKSSNKDVSGDEDYDPAEKFRDAVKEKKKKENNKIFTCKFPSYEMIEKVEAEHKFPKLDESMCNALYDILGDHLNTKSIDFRKVAQKDDEYSGYIKSQNSIGTE